MKYLYMILLFTVSQMAISQQDPMMPPWLKVEKKQVEKKVVKKKQEKWKLNQIVVTKKEKIANVNGEVLQEGEYINGAKIVEIKSDSIRLAKSGKTWSLELTKPIPTIRQ